MEKDKGARFLKRGLIKTILILIFSYLFFLFIWLGVKDYYGIGIARIATYLISPFTNVVVQAIETKEDIITVEFVPKKYYLAILESLIEEENVLINIDLRNFNYIINVTVGLPPYNRSIS
jgi:hypothetical protein